MYQQPRQRRAPDCDTLMGMFRSFSLSPRPIFTLLALVGCEPNSGAVAEFSGGEFDFFTENAKDECLGGAMEAIFMPEGVETPHEFQYPVYIAGYDELPLEYDVDFRDPFVGMPVRVEDGGEGVLAIRGSVMESVVLDQVKYGDCTVTMTVDADLVPMDADLVEGTAAIAISNPRGEDELCPVFDGDPCSVGLSLRATRR